MTRTSSSLAPRSLILALSSSVLVAACGSDDRTTAKFTGVDAAHLSRAVDAIGAKDVTSLAIVGLFIAGGDEPGCPRIATTGNVTTVTGGCTNDDGTVLAGSIKATNFQPLFGTNPAYDPSKPSTIEADHWSATKAGAAAESIDGTASISGMDADGKGGTLTGSTDAVLAGIAVHSEITYTCTTASVCTHGGDSWIDVDGVGAAELTGTWSQGDVPTGAITATGVDTLVLDVAASTDSCRVFSINGGAAQMVCDPDSPTARRAPTAGNPWLASLGR